VVIDAQYAYAAICAHFPLHCPLQLTWIQITPLRDGGTPNPVCLPSPSTAAPGCLKSVGSEYNYRVREVNRGAQSRAGSPRHRLGTIVDGSLAVAIRRGFVHLD